MPITVETTVAAPVDHVWRAYTTPAAITRWNAASDDWHTPTATVDLRPGGAFSWRMEAKDGSAGFDFAGTYTDVVEHERLAYTFGDRTAEVVFRPVPAGTDVRVTFDREPTHDPEQQRQGWQQILHNFKRYVESAETKMAKNTICLWYDHDAEEAARFYARTFPDSAVGAVRRAPSDFPGGRAGNVLTVEFTVCGVPCLGLNGGDAFKQSEAFSFQIATEDQAETDRYWDAIVGNGGAESACGWCKDRWGLSWQITPRVLTEAMASGGDVAKRAFEAMMTMRRIDHAGIEAAVRGEGAPV
jgi:predicted 3-demethylubiquinone-9 3-methyltransferase (glyoxalase superfamily)/uncharacterized protein YndB with AHSA1/START domain